MHCLDKFHIRMREFVVRLKDIGYDYFRSSCNNKGILFYIFVFQSWQLKNRNYIVAFGQEQML
jgi:hypothetical protein